jgi:hypothetical protein
MVRTGRDSRVAVKAVYAAAMASAELSRRVEKVVGYPPLSELSDVQRREFHEALLEAGSFEDLPGRWQAAIVRAEQNRPKLRIVGSD